MAFRNPITSLPASAITGQITGTQIADGSITTPKLTAGAITADKLDANALNGKVITGSTIQTSVGGRRVVMAAPGTTSWYTGSPLEANPGRIEPVGGFMPALGLFGPRMDAGLQDYGLELRQNGASTEALVTTDETTIVGNANVASIFTAGNMAWGSIQITPVANADTSLNVTGVGLTDAGSYRVWLCAKSGVPSAIKGLTANGESADGFTLWINRSSNTTTTVWWHMIAE